MAAVTELPNPTSSFPVSYFGSAYLDPKGRTLALVISFVGGVGVLCFFVA